MGNRSRRRTSGLLRRHRAWPGYMDRPCCQHARSRHGRYNTARGDAKKMHPGLSPRAHLHPVGIASTWVGPPVDSVSPPSPGRRCAGPTKVRPIVDQSASGGLNEGPATGQVTESAPRSRPTKARAFGLTMRPGPRRRPAGARPDDRSSMRLALIAVARAKGATVGPITETGTPAPIAREKTRTPVSQSRRLPSRRSPAPGPAPARPRRPAPGPGQSGEGPLARRRDQYRAALDTGTTTIGPATETSTTIRSPGEGPHVGCVIVETAPRSREAAARPRPARHPRDQRTAHRRAHSRTLSASQRSEPSSSSRPSPPPPWSHHRDTCCRSLPPGRPRVRGRPDLGELGGIPPRHSSAMQRPVDPGGIQMTISQVRLPMATVEDTRSGSATTPRLHSSWSCALSADHPTLESGAPAACDFDAATAVNRGTTTLGFWSVKVRVSGLQPGTYGLWIRAAGGSIAPVRFAGRVTLY